MTAVLIGALGWLIVDEFSGIDDRLREVRETNSELRQALDKARDANTSVLGLLSTQGQDLRDKIYQTNVTVNGVDRKLDAIGQKVDSLTGAMQDLRAEVRPLAALQEQVKQLQGQTDRMDGILLQAPWTKR